MGQFFSHDEVFPVVARLIATLHQTQGGFVSHTDLVRAMQSDEEGGRLVQFAVEQDTEQRPKEWWASNMIQWFSQRYPEENSEYLRLFERCQEKDGWAYKPCTTEK